MKVNGTFETFALEESEVRKVLITKLGVTLQKRQDEVVFWPDGPRLHMIASEGGVIRVDVRDDGFEIREDTSHLFPMEPKTKS